MPRAWPPRTANPAPTANRPSGVEAWSTHTVVIVVALAYLGLLFAIAWYGDRRANVGRSLIRSPVVYTFSLAVYCTSWTFYGAVGTAARRGIEFITIYTGPTIVFLGWWFLLRKIARISKSQRITSIADFIASRYGKSALLGMMVTVDRDGRHDAVHRAAAEGGVDSVRGARQLHRLRPTSPRR